MACANLFCCICCGICGCQE